MGEIEDLAKVAASMPARGSDWVGLSAADMTTERLTGRQGEVARELRDERGFALIRGLDAHDAEALRRMIWVIGNHRGTAVMQNARGEILREMFDRFAGAPHGIDPPGYESPRRGHVVPPGG